MRCHNQSNIFKLKTNEVGSERISQFLDNEINVVPKQLKTSSRLVCL
jgi:hypothetical protein